MTRLHHLGSLSRNIWLFIAALTSAALVIGLAQDGDQPLSIAWLIALGLVSVRAVMIGVEIEGDKVRFRGWFVTRTFIRGPELTFRSVPYSGFLNWDNVDGTGRLFEMVEVRTRSSGVVRSYPQRFSVARKSKSRAVVRALNSWAASTVR